MIRLTFLVEHDSLEWGGKKFTEAFILVCDSTNNNYTFYFKEVFYNKRRDEKWWFLI